MEINVKEARTKISSLLDRTLNKGEEVVILMRGKRVARLVPIGNTTVAFRTYAHSGNRSR